MAAFGNFTVWFHAQMHLTKLALLDAVFSARLLFFIAWYCHAISEEWTSPQEAHMLVMPPITVFWDSLNSGARLFFSAKGAITSKIKRAIKHKTSPAARLAQLLHNCCSPHWHFVLVCSQ